MFDFSFSELALIGAVALVVLGPERLPKVARTVGEWAGKAQRYVSQVKADINREMEVAELKKLQEQARDVARSIETSVQEGVSGLQSGLSSTAGALNGTPDDPQPHRRRRPRRPATTRGKGPATAGNRIVSSAATSPVRASMSCRRRSTSSSGNWPCPRRLTAAGRSTRRAHA